MNRRADIGLALKNGPIIYEITTVFRKKAGMVIQKTSLGTFYGISPG